MLWSALSFAACLAALAWVAGDVAARMGGRDRERWTRPLAVSAFAVFALLGSPALLFNAGFTNFMMAELLLTRQDSLDTKVIENASGLDFIVLDELHTYRGRQGADVAIRALKICSV